MNYLSILKKYGLSSDDLSTTLKKRIAEITKLESGIQSATRSLSEDNLSAKQRENLEAELEEAERILPELDEKLCAAIESWYPKRELYAARGRAMQAGRKGKRNGADNSKNTKVNEHVVKKPVETNVAMPATSNASSNTEKKNGMGTWKWVGIAALAAIATVVGINMHNSSGR